MSVILEKTKDALEFVGQESKSSNGVWRLFIGAIGLLIGLLTWEAGNIYLTVSSHSDALVKLRMEQKSEADALKVQNSSVNDAIGKVGSIEIRTRTLEDHFSKIDGKLDGILSVIAKPKPR